MGHLTLIYISFGLVVFLYLTLSMGDVLDRQHLFLLKVLKFPAVNLVAVWLSSYLFGYQVFVYFSHNMIPATGMELAVGEGR